ncbi:PREDICTED: transposable element Tc1 transposase [Trachymyrmex cornetzi]|uniref:transposable element Tc1 transposase n=1 Tax=Trachymyrmex cornetzi TaxID=471704 RepID=UPI00084F1D12|nr:PREDICTED: transposable element Tc1 transposase [Trachymyrmex cornetzi]
MSKTRELSEGKRAQIIVLHSVGLSQVQIAKKIKCSRCAVQTTIKRYNDTKQFKSRSGRGRKRKTTAREDRYLKQNALKDRRQTAKELTAALRSDHEISISAKTVSRRLNEFGIKARKARQKPWLSETNRKKRLAWAKKYKSWTASDWDKILWSDESNIQLFGTPGAVYVHRRIGEAYNPKCIVPTVKHGGEETEQVIFQQDDAPCHTARKSIAWFKRNKIKLFEWPPQSPDLNPIEHLWAHLKKHVRARKCTSITELKKAIFEEWEKISPTICERLVHSLPKRIAEVIKNNGGPSKY